MGAAGGGEGRQMSDAVESLTLALERGLRNVHPAIDVDELLVAWDRDGCWLPDKSPWSAQDGAHSFYCIHNGKCGIGPDVIELYFDGLLVAVYLVHVGAWLPREQGQYTHVSTFAETLEAFMDRCARSEGHR